MLCRPLNEESQKPFQWLVLCDSIDNLGGRIEYPGQRNAFHRLEGSRCHLGGLGRSSFWRGAGMRSGHVSFNYLGS